MSDKVRLNVQLSEEANTILEGLVKTNQTTRTDIIRQSIKLMKAAQEAADEGLHIGWVKDASKLDRKIILL